MALMVWLAARQFQFRALPSDARALRLWAILGLALLSVQIALGGWVSTNYAALACIDLPTCHGEWVPRMIFSTDFSCCASSGKRRRVTS